jgi:hypothetical protein
MLTCAEIPGKWVKPCKKLGVDSPCTENINPRDTNDNDRKLILIFRILLPAIPTAIEIKLARKETRLTI